MLHGWRLPRVHQERRVCVKLVLASSPEKRKAATPSDLWRADVSTACRLDSGPGQISNYAKVAYCPLESVARCSIEESPHFATLYALAPKVFEAACEPL
ncbi:hypothetical protein BAUCODRAFT_120009 [Baudoinia panamericana UAMH 10762]|uniref:Uncharacterized protein n=1 Tax=Baudoinia panamericana (strain UAMH 10762) TaxID=717646 RepID=M2NHZ8_BAUPA|nr:uncharacterized protein BAUCODRAFT_120009 [Baudoinia panamericana UAMH 10762]EMC98705.1 hypothetical protein BAUCODRAFT_120009 [Baudoinia panamericana UAMH 10762]